MELESPQTGGQVPSLAD